MSERRACPSDLSDARRELVGPVLAAWRAERRRRAPAFGRPPEHELREIMNAILYVDRTGVRWRCLPHDFPPGETVYGYFAKWQREGAFAQLDGLLRELVRQQEGRTARPSACVIDAQSVKTSTGVPAAGQGLDAGKKIVGRKRSIVTDGIYRSRERSGPGEGVSGGHGDAALGEGSPPKKRCLKPRFQLLVTSSQLREYRAWYGRAPHSFELAVRFEVKTGRKGQGFLDMAVLGDTGRVSLWICPDEEDAARAAVAVQKKDTEPFVCLGIGVEEDMPCRTPHRLARPPRAS